MKQRSWGTRWRGIGLSVALVAPCYLLSLANGVAVVEGCSGGASVGVAPPGAMIDRATGLAVATDGFFLLRTYLDPNSIVGQTTVKVTMGDGTVVPGALKVYPGTGASYLGWAAQGPLAVGTKLQVTVTQPPGSISAGDDFAELTVVGPPTDLQGATVSFSTWYDFHQGLGEPTTCLGASFGCGPAPLLTLYANDEQLHAADIAWKGQPQVNGFVLWEATLDLPLEQQQLNQAPTSIQISDWSMAETLGRLLFPASSKAFCATLRVRDLRTDQFVSVKTCAEPQPGETLRNYDDIARCAEPPAGPLAASWCAAHPESMLPVCKPGTIKNPDQPNPDPGLGDDPQPQPDPGLGDDPGLVHDMPTSGSRTSSACQLIPGPARGAVLGVMLVAVGVAAVGRRRRG